MTRDRSPAGGRIAHSGGLLAAVALSVLAVAAPVQAASPPTPRQFAQHLLRRFAFSASPATVNTVLAQGTSAWVMQQLNWQAIDDSKSQLNWPPTAYLTSSNCNGCLPNYDAFEAMQYQHDLLTNRQIQAKLELHWLEHFSINENNLDHPSVYNYDAVVRANALGNFAQLVAAVGVQPAMLWWLNNDYNNGSGPNVNWARELMQVYTIGEWQLNPDGSQVLKGGMPVPNYAEHDIKAMAKAMSGYHAVNIDSGNPMANYQVFFNPQEQYTGRLYFLGAYHNVPHNSSAIAYVVNILAHHPSAAPFQVTELLKRFVTETPSPSFIADIVAVWLKYQDAPDQIAQVVTAIINHPEFAASYHSMPKQPIEQVLGALRQLPGKMQAAPPAGFTWDQYHQAGQSLEDYLGGVNQRIFSPPNVFSFFLPGHVESMVTTAARVGATNTWTTLLMQSPPQLPSQGTGADVWIDLPTLQATAGSSGGAMADYLLDAMVDGGSPGLRAIISNYLGSTPSRTSIEGAVWLLLNSPEYAVN